MSKPDTIPDGPFTIEMKTAMLAVDPKNLGDYQLAEVTSSLPKGTVPTEESIIELTKEALAKVREMMPDKSVTLLSREQYANYVITGAPETQLAIGGPDDFALDFGKGSVSTRLLWPEDGRDD